MTVTTTSTVAPATTDTVIDAMRSIQTEGDRWNLADALAVVVPSGLQGFDRILDQAAAEGVAGNLKVNTLRLYRDTANRWPLDKRVPNVSFSAHREAQNAASVSDGVKVLTDLAKNLGPDKVTVAAVRKAIAVQQGRPIPGSTPKGGTTGTATTTLAVVADLMSGGAALIQTIDGVDVAELDKLYAGLSKVVAHVERIRAKVARKAAVAKGAKATPKVVAKTTDTNTNSAAPKAARKPQGDLRGM